MIGFICILLFLTEVNNGSVGESSATIFKRGSRSEIAEQAEKAVGNDEEKAQAEPPEASEQSQEDAQRALKEAKVESSIFSWHDLRYSIPIGRGQQRLLLEDVSGYVEPGKLTALMGESGAGKVRSWLLTCDKFRTVLTYFPDNFIERPFRAAGTWSR